METKEQEIQSLERKTSQQLNLLDSEQFAIMQRICALYANSELVPDIYRISEKNPKEKAIANCMVAIEMAQRISSSPLMVMQNLNVIYGRPSWSAKYLISTVNTCGRFNPIKYRFKEKGLVGKVEVTTFEKSFDKQTGRYSSKPVTTTFDGTNLMDIECVAYTSPKGSSDVLEGAPVSLKMAIKEGWYTKNGSKWQTIPTLMLCYRAATFWTNIYAPELSMGMKTTEELYDIEDVTFEEIPLKKGKEVINLMGDSPLIKEDAVNDESVKATQEEKVKVKEPKMPLNPDFFDNAKHEK